MMPHKSKPEDDATDAAATDLSALKLEMSQLRREVAGVRQQNAEIKKEVATISGMFLKKLEAAEQEIADLRLNVTQLQYHVAYTEQDNLKSYVEISGIAEYPGEDLCQIVMDTSQKVDVDLLEFDIDEVLRVGPKPSKRALAENRLLRPISLKLVSRRKRDEMLRNSKDIRNITSEEIVDGTPTKVYLNERLTPENRRLFRDARARAEKYGFRYCWVRNSAILVRQADGKPAIRIMSWADLDEHVGPADEPLGPASEILPAIEDTQKEKEASEAASEST